MECVANNVVSPLYVALGEEGEEGKAEVIPLGVSVFANNFTTRVWLVE